MSRPPVDTHSFTWRLFSASCAAAVVLGAGALVACGGRDAPAKPPEAAREAPDDTANQVSTSAEIGGLDEDKVDAVFKNALPDFQRCLGDGAKRLEFLGGSVGFFVQIDTSGKADQTYLEKSTLGDRRTEVCMLDSLRRKRWPKPVGGLHGLARKSFDFDPPNDVRAPSAWDADRVSASVAKQSHALVACKKGNRGRFEATLYVATDGSVMSAGVTPPDDAGEADVDCLVDALKATAFPSPGSWPAKVTFPL